MNRSHLRSALGSVGLLLVAGLAACSSDSPPAVADSGVADVGTPPADTGTPPTDTGAPPTDTGTPPTDTGAPPTDAGPGADVPRTAATVAGVVHLNEMATANATVTVVDRAGATVTTGADGAFSFSLPIGSTQLLRASHPDARTILVALQVPTDDITALPLELNASADLTGLFTEVAVVEDTTKGMLFLHFRVATPPQPAGFGAMLSVAGGSRIVVAESGPMLSDTTLANEGTLVIANVPVGNVTVTPIVPAGRTCTATYGVTTVRVDARTITDLSFTCQ